jgi:glycosyltransferase involved in cell wall biosynthesis
MRLPIVRTRHISAAVPRNALSRWLYRRAARIVTAGEALRQDLIERTGVPAERIESVPTGADPAVYQPGDRHSVRTRLGLPNDAMLIGIVATLRSWKGHRFLLEAMPKLRRADVHLAIVGDGPQRAALEAQTDALGLRSRVLFVGQQNDVAPWLSAFDVFALPSYANEGVPQALLQAMFAGVPCVTTDAGAIPEIARDGETALVVPREDPVALAAALDRLLLVPSVAGGLAERARAFVLPRFTLATMLDRMEAVFQRALAEARR